MNEVNIPYRKLPSAASECLANYSQVQIENFRSRLRYIEEVTIKVDEWLDSDWLGQDREFINRIELDLLINIGAAGSEREISAWQVHTTWAPHIDAADLRATLELRELVPGGIPEPLADRTVFLDWLRWSSQKVKALLVQAFASSSDREFIACLLMLDVWLAHLYSGVVMRRLSSDADLA